MTEKILIIDDDRELCEEIEEVLSNEGYHVEKAFDPQGARERLGKTEYEVVVLDLKMQGNGFNLLKQIKQEKSSPRVVIITANPLARKESNQEIPEEEKKKLEALQRADDIIAKPFSIERLIKAIHKLLDTDSK
jgi:DNA-binding response OmpR family regulator